ncbi:MAG: carboxypeptidase-like regulatory domain-containing protein [Bacteroidales bacterium]
MGYTKSMITLLLTLIFALSYGQDEKLVQLTGRIKSELLQPLPFSHILIMNSMRGTITDSQGKFSMVTSAGDTVLFSSLGYKKKQFIIPDNLSEPFITMDIVLAEDTFMINEVVIYPWRNYEEFKQAFLNLELPDDDMERARKNIALLKTQIILENSPNARQNFQHVMNQQYQETFTQGTFPSYQIFNPLAWIKFFEAIKRGDYKNKK